MNAQRTSDRVTVEDVKQAVIWRIHTGMHPASSRLPPVRDLARELGANRNTVNKAYRQLCEAGVITLSPGNRGFLVKDEGALIAAADDFQRCAREMIWRAMVAGIPREQITQDLLATVASVYASHRLRMIFIECNAHDSAEMARELSALVGEPVEACVLRDAVRRARALARQNDLIITTFHHLAEVSQIFGECAEQVVGVDTRPSPDTLLRIARLTGPRIGLVCTLENTARSLHHIIKSYHPDRAVDTALADDAAGVRRLTRACDHVIVTHTAAEQFARIAHRQPDVVVQFCVDEQSIAYLKQRMRQARLNGYAMPIPNRAAVHAGRAKRKLSLAKEGGMSRAHGTSEVGHPVS
ncbi:MAG: winged helix-turn-helix domain-containing protein [Anaerolineae bacterium]|nr:winged helix-turn-helix domain-containing protein [Candidatus Roseilinea sp.]MDW8451228.1 winged helix-turn-helix domain-containing protein [Anaerolineae bacterium]